MTEKIAQLAIEIEVAERQLDRTHAFFSRIDAKNSALLAMASAEFAVLALNIGLTDLKVWYLAIPIVLFAVTILVAGYHLYNCSFPSLEGGSNSFVYFREIARRTEVNFVHGYLALTRDELLADLAGQIWRNSEIVSKKYESIQTATKMVMLSLALWLFALGALAMTHGRVSH